MYKRQASIATSVSKDATVNEVGTTFWSFGIYAPYAIIEPIPRLKLKKASPIAIKNDTVLKDNKDLDKFLANITIIEKDLVSIFEKNRIKKINSKGQKFDPNLHQAMSEIEDENVNTGTILKEIQAGYMLGERLLRPALVAVAKKKEVKKEKISEKKEDK